MKVHSLKLISIIAFAALSQGCNYQMSKGGSVDGSSYGIGTNSVSEQKALGVLATNCASCHAGSPGAGGVSNILNVPSILSAGLVIPGNPSGSPVMSAIERGVMPPSGPLSAADQAIIRDWIAGGGSGSPGTPTNPPTTATPLPPSPVTGSLEQKAVAILQNNCFACHGTIASGGIDGINNPSHLISIGAVIAGSATTSKIYDAISKNRMPPSGALAAADQSIIADWINQGAKTPAPGTVVPAPTPIPLAGNFKSLNANIFMPKCVTCHGATSASGGIRLDSYTSVLKYVNKTTPSQSKVYSATKGGDMPPSPNPKLSAGELSAILSWITAGALNN
jgi:uncharacterized membrane protein